MLLASVPASLLGGLTPVSADVFYGLLGVMLLVAGLGFFGNRILPRESPAAPVAVHGNTSAAAGIGLVIGYLSGMVGIGGGIFLAPVLHFLKWDTPKRIAAAASLYIAANSAAALIGKFVALGDIALASDAALRHWPLAIAVLLGGAVGRRVLTSKLPERSIKLGTAALIIYVAYRILVKAWKGLA